MTKQKMFEIKTFVVAYYNNWTNEFESLKTFKDYSEALKYKESKNDYRWVLLGEVK